MNKKLASLLLKIGANGAQAIKELKVVDKSVEKFAKSCKKYGSTLTKSITLPLTALAGVSIKTADTQLKAEAKLLNALKGREEAQRRLMSLASEIQGRTLFGDEELIKLHYHTNTPWKVLEYCRTKGEIFDIVVEDMDRQSRGLQG
jgi:hypothetical protein